MSKTLLIMAAGMGSRYGGNKQVDRIGPGGEILMEYGIHDAVQAGFDHVVFVIKRSMDEMFREMVGDKVAEKVRVDYAYQEFDSLPGGFQAPEGRTKPYGTVHAVLSAKDVIDGNFAVINADDYYGQDAFAAMSECLDRMEGKRASMVAYDLCNTVSPNGTVTRGVCEVKDGLLQKVVETYKIRPMEDGTIRDFGDEKNPEGVLLRHDAPVSMNFWGFTPWIMEKGEERLKAFLSRTDLDPMKCEYVLPTLVDELMHEDGMPVEVLTTHAVWFGMTYREDRALVQEELRKLHEKGVYPDTL
ncbi:MAG: nucleotidyltransferase [Clostridia bacterium]|nr:nucleotidyltransferase [Clostridia bacterium]